MSWCVRVYGCVCVCVGASPTLRPNPAITHIVIEHTRSNAFCLDFIFSSCCCSSFLQLLLLFFSSLLLLLLASPSFWVASCSRHVLGCFWPRPAPRPSLVLLYAFGFGVVDIKCKTEFHFRQECCYCICCCCCRCYWECYNIVEACNILPRIRVAIHPTHTRTLAHTHTYVFPLIMYGVFVLLLLTISFFSSLFQHIFLCEFSLLVLCVCVCVCDCGRSCNHVCVCVSVCTSSFWGDWLALRVAIYIHISFMQILAIHIPQILAELQ